MGSNFEKCTFLETGTGGTYSRGEGVSLKGAKPIGEWRPKGNIVGGCGKAHVALPTYLLIVGFITRHFGYSGRYLGIKLYRLLDGLSLTGTVIGE